MADESLPKLEQPLLSEAVEAKMREYRAERDRKYHAAVARLEDAEIEPQQRRAYEATVGELLALPLGDVAWPQKDPRYRLHRAMKYGDDLDARRADIEDRFGGRLPPPAVYSINRYALAALHAFKAWRHNPEPKGSFGEMLQKAATLRSLLRSQLSCVIAYKNLRVPELRHFDGGITPENIACDLSLLSGVLKNLPPALTERMVVTPVDLMEATLVARDLLQNATRHGAAELWQPLVLYARALTLVDDASFHAELVLSEFHNAERDPLLDGTWDPECLFCDSDVERQRHRRHEVSPKAARQHAQFVSSTMTATLGRQEKNN